ncbi:MAG: hypothetical protein HZC37_21770 [Burkholderiales bacterium]|nr:hypothetical protein [Burkholderiales bacterium]
MNTRMRRAAFIARLHALLWGLALLASSGCGGGGSGAPAPMQGSTESHAIASRVNGRTYPLRVYLPPASAGARSTLPVIYALDGDWWFTQLVDIAEASSARDHRGHRQQRRPRNRLCAAQFLHAGRRRACRLSGVHPQ